MPEQMIQRIIGRIMRIVNRDLKVFGEIAQDEKANTEAIVLVVAASFLAALGTARSFGGFVLVLIMGIVVNWLLWSWVISFIGTQFLKIEAEFWPIARIMGYASIPMAFALLSRIQCIAWLGAVISLLTLVIAFFALREVLRQTTERTLILVGGSWAVVIVITVILAILRAAAAIIA